MAKLSEECKIMFQPSGGKSRKHWRTCVIPQRMKTLNTNLSDQEWFSNLLWSATGILIQR